MVADALIASLVGGQAAAAVRPGLDRANAARDASCWAPIELRMALVEVAGQVRGLQ